MKHQKAKIKQLVFFLFGQLENMLRTLQTGICLLSQFDPSKVDCDAYEYRHNNPDAIKMYRGEYVIQYSWPRIKDE